MIAIVIIRLVAILQALVSQYPRISHQRDSVPTGHAPQSLDTCINVALTLLQVVPRIGDLLPLLIECTERPASDILRVQCHALTLL